MKTIFDAIVSLNEKQHNHLNEQSALIDELDARLEKGRNYLMQIGNDKITVEDALEAFGFGRNGLED